MNAGADQESEIRYYGNGDSAGIWTAMMIGGVVMVGGASMAVHSWILTGTLVLGAGVLWWAGYWTLSKSTYFISPAKAGFKDVFRTREVRFDDVRSVTKNVGRYSSTLIFVCDSGEVAMPFDPIDEAWFFAVKAELGKRGIKLSTAAFGVVLKEE
jgi:hypothetical protein